MDILNPIATQNSENPNVSENPFDASRDRATHLDWARKIGLALVNPGRMQQAI